jgi:hypothetical protein
MKYKKLTNAQRSGWTKFLTVDLHFDDPPQQTGQMFMWVFKCS